MLPSPPTPPHAQSRAQTTTVSISRHLTPTKSGTSCRAAGCEEALSLSLPPPRCLRSCGFCPRWGSRPLASPNHLLCRARGRAGGRGFCSAALDLDQKFRGWGECVRLLVVKCGWRLKEQRHGWDHVVIVIEGVRHSTPASRLTSLLPSSCSAVSKDLSVAQSECDKIRLWCRPATS